MHANRNPASLGDLAHYQTMNEAVLVRHLASTVNDGRTGGNMILLNIFRRDHAGHRIHPTSKANKVGFESGVDYRSSRAHG